MSDINTFLKNAAVVSNGLNPVPVNAPAQYIDRKRQFFDPETRAFTMQKARFSSDFVEAQVQGLDPNDPTGWGTYRIRFADVVRPSSAIQRHFDDYKQFLFESVVISQIGCALGVFMGVLAGNLVAMAMKASFIIPWLWILAAIVVCLVVGIASGYIPAVRASRLDPIEALRYE